MKARKKLATSSILDSFMPYLLPLVEVFLNLALFATRLCLFLSLHLSTCPSASPTSRSHPTPPSSVMRRWMVLCHSPGSSEGRRSVWGKCQSLTGGGIEAGWKMSSFTGKSCEPRNVSSSSNPPSPSLPFFLCSLSVGAQWMWVWWEGRGMGRKGGGVRSGVEVTQQIFSSVKEGGCCLWEEADKRLRKESWRGKSPSAEEMRGSISRWGGLGEASLFRLEGPGWILGKD